MHYQDQNGPQNWKMALYLSYMPDEQISEHLQTSPIYLKSTFNTVSCNEEEHIGYGTGQM